MGSVYPTKIQLATLESIVLQVNRLIDLLNKDLSVVVEGGGVGDVQSPIIPGVIDNTIVLYDGLSGKRLKASTIYANWFDQAVATTSSPIFVASTSGSVVTPAVFTAQVEPTGFVDRTATLSFVDATRTFTITGNHTVYYAGVASAKTTASIEITDDAGLHYIYYDTSFNLATSVTFPMFSVPLLAYVYWDTVSNVGILEDERHGIVMDHATHRLIHETIGTRYGDGLAGTFGDTTFSVASGSIWDEDIHHEFDSAITTCRLIYKNGAANFVWDSTQTLYYKLVTGSLQYNNGNTLAPVDSNKYVAAWIFATNSVDSPIVAMIGQRQDTLLAEAQANNTYASLSLSDMPFKEYKVLYRVLLRNDGTPFVETKDLRSMANISSGAYLATSHNALTGLDYASAGHTGFLPDTHLTDFTHADIAHANRSALDLVTNTNTGDQDLSGLALKTNVLELDNTVAFTPNADYEPATKKYADALNNLTDTDDGKVYEINLYQTSGYVYFEYTEVV